MVSFTGSSTVGRRVMALAASGPRRVHLELGGKAPFVVFDDADLEAAVHGAVAASLINTAQDCTAATRAQVQRPLFDAFLAGVADLMATVRLDVYRSLRATREIRAGCVWINDHIPIISKMPHGGYKSSGFGKDMDWHRTIFGTAPDHDSSGDTAR
jgi:acyl-CoA reductase-like NAD-dependent aldehyde dehydrogenase